MPRPYKTVAMMPQRNTFKKSTAAGLIKKFMPIVKIATANLQLAQQYTKFAQTSNKFGLVTAEQVKLAQ